MVLGGPAHKAPCLVRAPHSSLLLFALEAGGKPIMKYVELRLPLWFSLKAVK
jgi:hypothetical protein